MPEPDSPSPRPSPAGREPSSPPLPAGEGRGGEPSSGSARPPPFVRTWVHRDVIDSTNDLARSLAGSGQVALPMLVQADRQTRGRGRGRNTWWSDAGSLTFSLAL